MTRTPLSLRIALVASLGCSAALGQQSVEGAEAQPQDIRITSADASGEPCTDHAAHGDHSGYGSDGHAGHDHILAPIGVMGDHLHHQGEWMISYRYMRMEMDGMQNGTDKLSTAEVLADYMVAPTAMTMEMHMLGGMYGVTDEVTMSVMVPWVVKSMDHVTRMSTEFTTDSSGLGDIKIGSLYGLDHGENHDILLNFAVSLPTGSIDEKGDMPSGANMQMAWPMQLGSGSWELWPGITYTGHSDDTSWGAQAVGVFRLDTNDRDYRLGNELRVTTWIGQRLWDRIVPSLRLDYRLWAGIHGQDPDLNPGMAPPADFDNSGGQRLDGLLGLELRLPELGHGSRLAFEGGLPLYQNLYGTQMSVDWTFTGGLQIVF